MHDLLKEYFNTVKPGHILFVAIYFKNESFYTHFVQQHHPAYQFNHKDGIRGVLVTAHV